MAEEFEIASPPPTFSGLATPDEILQMMRSYDLNLGILESYWRQSEDARGSRVYVLLAIVARLIGSLKERVRQGRQRRRAAPLGIASANSPVAVSMGAAAESVDIVRRIWRVVRRKSIQMYAVTGILVRGTKYTHTRRFLPSERYASWFVMYQTLRPPFRQILERRIGMLEHQPKISVVMPLYNSSPRYLRLALKSLEQQLYQNFEVIMVDDGSTTDRGRAVARDFVAKDNRFSLVLNEKNGGISRTTNTAIAQATGEWIAFMDHDDLLVEHALALMVSSAEKNPQWWVMYSDEDLVNERGLLSDPYFKGDFDPLLLLGQNYMPHFTMVRRELVNELGGLRPEFDGAQDWDFLLRATERAGRNAVGHVPFVLYHWRSHSGSTRKNANAKPYAKYAGQRAVEEALARRGQVASVENIGEVGYLQVTFSVPVVAPMVTVIIPTRDGELLSTAVNSVLDRTTYDNFEIVVIDNGSVQPEILEYFSSLPEKVRVLRDDSPFNYSALHNRVVPQCRGEILLLLNDDTEVINGNWLCDMVALISQPDVAVVGARLLFPDQRIQHAGVILGPSGLADHVSKFEPGYSTGYYGRVQLVCEYSAVTAACMAIRRSVWEELGGLDESFQVAWNDIDFCLRVRAAGYVIAYAPTALLYHYESLSRGDDGNPEKYGRYSDEVSRLRHRWFPVLMNDPYYSPNHSVTRRAFDLAFPPRVSLANFGFE